MSAFDQSFNKASTCYSICSVDRQSDRTLEDDLTLEDRQKKQEMDEMLAQSMKALTFQERQQEQEIVHGVEQKIKEEKTFIDASLQELERQLATIKSDSVYEMAEKMDPEYVTARAFRIMFLRSTRYDVKAAADKMIRFFEVKQQLFGASKLVKTITLQDLDEDDIAALKTGYLQIVGKDSAGRVLMANFPGLRGQMTLQSELTMRFYVLMSLLEEEETQLTNFIPIGFAVGDMRDRFGGGGFFETAKVAFAVPGAPAAIHLCTDEIKQYLIQAAVLKAAPLKLRSRIKLHFGSQTECLYQMSTYGIPHGVIPVDPNSHKISLKRHLEWVESRLAMGKKERPLPAISIRTQGTVTSPGVNDVLICAGKKSNNMGNHRLRALVKELSQAYATGSKEAKKALVDCAISSVKDSGGRFLREQNVDSWNVVWKEMPMDQIRKNVAQAFRNNNRHRKKTNDDA